MIAPNLILQKKKELLFEFIYLFIKKDNGG